MKFFAMLKASSGCLITGSSTAAFHATRGKPAYNASKAGAPRCRAEVAQITLSLCLPAASYRTGAVIPVDGGLMARNA